MHALSRLRMFAMMSDIDLGICQAVIRPRPSIILIEVTINQ